MPWQHYQKQVEVIMARKTKVNQTYLEEKSNENVNGKIINQTYRCNHQMQFIHGFGLTLTHCTCNTVYSFPVQYYYRHFRCSHFKL